MSDTTTITQEERTLWLKEAQPKSVGHYETIDFEMDKRIRRLLTALEAAEARADFASSVLEAASDCIVSGDPAIDVGLFLECDEFDKKLLVDISALSVRAEKAEAENARLRAERDWLSENIADRPCAYDICPFGLHRPTGPDDDDCDKTHVQCWLEAARRAVGEGK